MTLTESELTERLDERGLLTESHRPGVYALKLADPGDSIRAIIDRWTDHFDADIPGNYATRLSAADRLLYVGSHGRSIYDRLTQHVRGHKSSTIMDIYPPVDVVNFWHEDHPRDHEWGHAVDLARDGTVVWCDGSLI